MILASLALAAAGESGSAPLAVEVKVADQVVRAKIPRIGFNLCQNPFDDRSTVLGNWLNSNPGLESGIVCRWLFVAGAGDAKGFPTTVSWFLNDEQRQIVGEGFWSGAEYRVLAGKGGGRKGRIARCTYADRNKLQFTAEDEGVAFAAGDLIVVTQTGGKAPLNASLRDLKRELVAEGEHAPQHGGASCLKFVATTGKKEFSGFWLPTFARWGGGRGGERDGNADRFVQEKAYRITLWAKGTPGLKASVRFVASSEYDEAKPDDFLLTDAWKKYELVRKSDPMVNLVIGVYGPGEMWLDGLVISEDDGGKPLAILPRMVDALAELRPGTLRLVSGARGETVDNWLAHPLERLRSVAPRNQSLLREPDQPGLPHGLALCERVGAAPWLVIGLAMGDDEWDHLLEYLAGPASTAYGARRARDGQPDPWLNTFSTIYLELGDEVWNKAKAPWCVEDPARYAAIAEHVFSRIRKNPYWSPKFRLVAGGCAGNAKWNDALLAGCTSLDVLGGSTAIAVQEVNGGADVATMQARLLAWPLVRDQPQLDALFQAAKGAKVAAALTSCGTASAEPGFLGPERSLLRSQSSAVAVLDDLLLALAGGGEAAIYTQFAQGSDNATHVDAHGLVLHPAAQAIRLYNQHIGGGDLLQTTVGPATPALAAYACKGADGYRVLLLNRSPTADCRVTVSLPQAGGKAHCLRIAHPDPLAGNLNQTVVTTEEFETDPAKGIAVPAHGLVLAVIK